MEGMSETKYIPVDPWSDMVAQLRTLETVCISFGD